jgi:hypothetical protein
MCGDISSHTTECRSLRLASTFEFAGLAPVVRSGLVTPSGATINLDSQPERTRHVTSEAQDARSTATLGTRVRLRNDSRPPGMAR